MITPEMAPPIPAADRVPRPVVSNAALLFGIFGAPFAWSVVQCVNYAIDAQACFPSRYPLARPVMSETSLAVGVIEILAILLAAVAVATAVRCWITTRGAGDWDEDATELVPSRVRFMALAGVLASVLFLGATIMSGIPVVMLKACT